MTNSPIKSVKLPLIISLMILTFASMVISAKGNDRLATATPFPPTISSTTTPRTVNEIQILLLSNSDCTPPCFLETYPGETTAQEIELLVTETLGLSPLSPFPFVTPDGLSDYDAYMNFGEGSLAINFIVDDERLTWTKVSLIEPEEWLEKNPLEFTEILRLMGTPNDIYVSVQGSLSTLSLTLVYENAGVMVQYIVNHREVTRSESIPVCPQPENIQFIYAWLQNPMEEDRELTEHLDPSPEDQDAYRANWPLELIVDTNPTEFAEFFIENPAGCLEALSYTELRENGYRA